LPLEHYTYIDQRDNNCKFYYINHSLEYLVLHLILLESKGRKLFYRLRNRTKTVVLRSNVWDVMLIMKCHSPLINHLKEMVTNNIYLLKIAPPMPHGIKNASSCTFFEAKLHTHPHTPITS